MPLHGTGNQVASSFTRAEHSPIASTPRVASRGVVLTVISRSGPVQGPYRRRCGPISPHSRRDCVKSRRSSYTGLYPPDSCSVLVSGGRVAAYLGRAKDPELCGMKKPLRCTFDLVECLLAHVAGAYPSCPSCGNSPIASTLKVISQGIVPQVISQGGPVQGPYRRRCAHVRAFFESTHANTPRRRPPKHFAI